MPREKLHIGELHDRPIQDTTQYLTVNSCGVQRASGSPYRVIRKNGRKDYHILYVESGTCRVLYEGTYRTLSCGEYVLYAPYQKQEYSFPEGTPSVSCWLHFHGTHTEQILSDCKLKSGIYTAYNPVEAGALFYRLSHASHATFNGTETKKNSLLLSLFTALSANSNRDDIPNALHSVIQHLQTNYASAIQTEALSRMCNLSPGRFLHTFKEQMGISPHQYLLSLRIDHAKELLLSDNLPVSVIASMVGFDDPFYFCRLFKKKTGETPLQFRKKGT